MARVLCISSNLPGCWHCKKQPRIKQQSVMKWSGVFRSEFVESTMNPQAVGGWLLMSHQPEFIDWAFCLLAVSTVSSAHSQWHLLCKIGVWWSGQMQQGLTRALLSKQPPHPSSLRRQWIIHTQLLLGSFLKELSCEHDPEWQEGAGQIVWQKAPSIGEMTWAAIADLT